MTKIQNSKLVSDNEERAFQFTKAVRPEVKNIAHFDLKVVLVIDYWNLRSICILVLVI